MRIRGSAAASSVFPVTPSSCSSASSSCFSSSSSTSASTHSTISDHSLSSSSNSTSPFSLSLFPRRRCHGLDLLVKAVYHVAGSVVGVPYIQKRVIRRRKPALRFSNFVIGSDKEKRELEIHQVGEVLDANSEDKKKKKKQQRRRSKDLHSKPVIRRRRRSKA